MKRTRFVLGGVLVAAALVAPAAVMADEPEWKQVTLLDHEVDIDLRSVEVRLLTIEGSVNADDDRTFDITITAAGQRLPVVTIYTGGVVQPFRHNLVSLPIGQAIVRIVLDYQYDADQYVCAAGLGGGCAARLPLDALHHAWLMEGGREAALFVKVGLTMNGERTADRRIGIPLLGQVVGIVQE